MFKVTLTAGGKISAYAIQNQSYTNDSHESTSDFLGITTSHHAQEDSVLSQTARVTELQSTDSLESQSGGDTLLQATRIAAPEISVKAGVGPHAQDDAKIILEGVKETTQTSHTETDSSLLWQKMQGEGSTTQTLKLANLSVNPTFSAPGGVIAQLPQGDFKTQLGQLAQQPGQEWLTQLSQSDTATWQQVALAHEHWQYEHEGLTPVAAIIIAVVVAIMTSGAGASMLTAAGETAATTATTAAGATVVTEVGLGTVVTTTAVGATTTTAVATTTLGAVASAGVSTLASQAAVSLVNNKGDIGQTLEDLGSSDTVKQILASMLTAGVGASFGSNYGVGRLVAGTVAGCASGELTGAGCEKGATFAATTGVAAWFYNSTMGYDANFGPGRNPEYPFYIPDETTGRQPAITFGNNVIGFNEAGNLCSQGSTCSRVLNNVPFINATAGFHDYIFNADLMTQDPLSNIAAMLPAAIISIPATLNGTTLLLTQPPLREEPR